MRKFVFSVLLLSGYYMAAMAQSDTIYIYRQNQTIVPQPIESIYDIFFNAAADSMYIETDNGKSAYAVQQLDSVTFDVPKVAVQRKECISVLYDASSATIVNPYSAAGVTVIRENGSVIVTSTTEQELEYRLSGTGSGSFKIYSDKKFKLTLDGLSLTSSDGPAINIQSGKKATVTLTDGTRNSLIDASTYTSSGTEDMKGCFFSEGKLVFEGNGTLDLTGVAAHALCSDDHIEVESGNITIVSAAKDGVHVNDYFRMKGGTLTVDDTAGDAVDADAGYIAIDGGTLKLTLTADDVKGMKCDSTFTMNGGALHVRHSGAQGKGIKCGMMTINGGEMTFICSGKAVVTSGDPSYCTAVKCDGNFTLNDGTIGITHTGMGGKGISCDGLLSIQGGEVIVTVSGAGAIYTNASNTKDAYSSTCLSGDTDVNLQGGTVTLTNFGSGGKCLKADGQLTIGESSHTLVLTAETTGAKITVSGSGENADCCNPKAIKSTGNLTVNNGTINVTTMKDGGEGLESKSNMTINDGELTISAYDDALQAKGIITVNGGKIYAYASNNDGIDSNTSSGIIINGGIIIANGADSPEEGIDLDNGYIKLTGGVLFTMGGSMGGKCAAPSASTATQPAAMLGNISLIQNQYLTIAASDGTNIFTIKIPRTQNGCYSLVSSPLMKNGTTYTAKTGTTAPIVYESVWNGIYLGSNGAGTTQVATWTQSSNFVSTGSTGGGGGGGPRW